MPEQTRETELVICLNAFSPGDVCYKSPCCHASPHKVKSLCDNSCVQRGKYAICRNLNTKGESHGHIR